jgi:hypothetical protein
MFVSRISRSHTLGLLAVIGMLTLACAMGPHAATAQNLISNPSAESTVPANSIGGSDDIADWTETTGVFSRPANEENDWVGTDFAGATAGSNAFALNSGNLEVGSEFNLQQDLTGGSVSGGVTYSFSGDLKTTASDAGRFIVEYRDGSGTVLDSYDSGYQTTGSSFTTLTDSRTAPAGTNRIRVRLVTQENDGASGSGFNDVFFDNLRLEAQGAPLTAADDGVFIAEIPNNLSVAAPGLLENDALGDPNGDIASFGGGSLGGSVTSNTAGSSVSLAGGTLTVNADGSFTLDSSPSQVGTYTFQYRLSNGSESSEGTVTIEVTPNNLIANPSAESVAGTNDIADWTEAPGVLSNGTTNDWIGFQDDGVTNGSRSFAASPPSPPNGSTFNLQQDVTGGAVTGGTTFDFSADAKSIGSDAVRVILEYRDGSGTVLDSYDSGFLSTNGATTELTDTRTAPSGTALIRVRLQAREDGGSNDASDFVDAFVDNLQLFASTAPLNAASDGPFTVPANSTLSQADPGVLVNDSRGTPEGSIASFGGGDLGGTVTSNTAGASVPFAGGTLTVNADGSFTLSSPTTLGTATFQYRLANGSEQSDATVTVDVQPATGDNLVQNASAENTTANDDGSGSDIADWMEIPNTLGNGTRNDWGGVADLGTTDGANAFGPANAGAPISTEFVLQQDVSGGDVAGGRTYAFAGDLAATGPDEGRIVVEYRDGSGTVLGSYDSGYQSTGGTFTSVSDTRTAPAGTNVIRVRLLAREQGGSSSFTDAVFDNLSLSVENTPVQFQASSPVGFTIDEDAAPTSLDADLAADDPDADQVLQWDVETAPAHGIISGLPTNASAGGSGITPTGVTYTPNTDFSGTDAFTIRVFDGTEEDLLNVDVTVNPVNDAPTALSLNPATPSINENNTTPATVASITVADDNEAGSNNVLSLSGVDADAFALDGTNLQLTEIADFETKSSYSVTVVVDDPGVGASPDATQDLTLSVNDLPAPTATTGAITNTTTTTADLSGTVNPNGVSTDVTFVVAPTSAPSNTQDVTASESPLTGSTDQAVSAPVTGLSPGVEYQTFVRATSAEGTTAAPPVTFTTTGVPEADLFVETSPRTELASGASFAFADTPVGGSTTQTFTIENNGSATLTLTGVATSPTSPTSFSVDASGAAPTIAPGSSTSFDVTFAPASVGTVSLDVEVSNNDSDENPYTVTLNGTGTNATPTVTTNAGATVDQGGPVTITQAMLETTDANDGPFDLTYTITSGPSNGVLLIDGFEVSEAPGPFPQALINDPNIALTYLNDGTAGTDSFTFEVSDGSTTVTGTFDLTVNAVSGFEASASVAVREKTGLQPFPNTGVNIDFDNIRGRGRINVVRIGEAPADQTNIPSDLTVGGTRFLITAVGNVNVGGGEGPPILENERPVDLQIDALGLGLPDLSSIRLFSRDEEGTGPFTEATPVTYDPATDLLTTTVTRFSEFVPAGPATFAVPVSGQEGTGNDTGFRMLAFPNDFTRANLEDDLDFTTTSGSILQTFPGGDASGADWVEVTASGTTIERGQGFILYFFDDATDPVGPSGIPLDVPSSDIDFTQDFTTPPLNTDDEFEVLGNPFDEDFDLAGLGPATLPGATLADAGFGATVAIWNPNRSAYEFFTQGAAGDEIPAHNAFVLQRTTPGSGDTQLTFDADSRTGSQTTPVGTAPGSPSGAPIVINAAPHSSPATGFQTVKLDMEATDGPTTSRATAQLLMAPNDVATAGWDAYDFSALAPPSSSDGYALAGFPAHRDGTVALRAVASLPHDAETAVDIDVPLHVQSVGLSGSASLALDPDVSLPADWTVELVDTNPSGSASEVVHDLRTGEAYPFEVADGNALAAPSDARFRLRVSAAPLPVELTTFSGTRSDTGTGPAINLTWRTASETNNTGFEVQRRADSTAAWQSIGFVEGAGTTDTPQTYRFQDTSLPFAATQLTYRLRQVDTDGTEHFSDPFVMDVPAPQSTTLRTPFPNPTQGAITLRYTLAEPSDVQLQIYDLLGRRVTTLTRTRAEAGRHELQTSVRDLAAGTYFVRLVAGGTSATKRLTVIR